MLLCRPIHRNGHKFGYGSCPRFMELQLLRSWEPRLTKVLMRHTTKTISLLISLLCSSLLAQGTPLPQQGSVVAEYTSLIGNTPFLLGLDLSTRSRFIVRNSPRGDFDILFVDRHGNTFEGRAGESTLLPCDSGESGLPTHTFADAFPFLLSEMVPQLPDEVVTFESRPDGTSVYTCQLLSGGLGLTIRGLPEGFVSESREIKYTFSSEGKLISKHDSSNDLLDEFTYAESDCPQLAIPASFSNGNWVLTKYECYESFPSDVFSEEYITDRARNMLVSHNERRNERMSTNQVQKEITELQNELSGNSAQAKTKQWALVITGLLVIGVGSLAWWRNRS